MIEPKIYITSDLHLGHSNIIRYCKRPYADVEEMNRELIKNWNSTVSDQDRVFFLGDFSLGSRESAIHFGQQLRGRKVMIYGNHDHHKPRVYHEAGFEYVSRWPIVIQNRYLLSHAPMFDNISNGIGIGDLINIYGHIHDNVEQGQTITARSACVCLERWDYRPVELSVIENEIKALCESH